MQRIASVLCATVLLQSACAKRVVVVGAGWGGLSAAHNLAKQPGYEVALLDAAPRVGGLIRDGYTTPGGRRAEAGQHGFWAEYANVFGLIDELGIDRENIFTQFAEQGQYSPAGLEAVWPVYAKPQPLPTGLAPGLYTRFLNLPPTDLITAAPLAAALAAVFATTSSSCSVSVGDSRWTSVSSKLVCALVFLCLFALLS